MKVLVINGSPHVRGCTARALEEAVKTLHAEGIETELIEVGSKKISGCLGCNYCGKAGKCVQNDLVNEVSEKLKEADGLLVGSPVYYGSPNGTLLSFLDRLFYSAPYSMHMKVGAAIVSCRRGGAASAFDVLNKYFTISGMPVASSTYWNSVHGFTAADVEKDLEGLQTVPFLIRSIAAQKEGKGLPVEEHGSFTSFPDGK